MQSSAKKLAWLLLPTLIIGGFVWFVSHTQVGIKTSYYEWGVTYMIMAYAENHDGTPPTSWDDLVGYEYHCKYLPNPRSIKVAAEHVSVDFDSLHAFTNDEITELPARVITPIRGREIHWISPKSELEMYFRGGDLPEGAYTDEQAADFREATL